MQVKARYPNLIRTSLYAALLAWFGLQSLSFAHAEDFDHSDSASHHCIICTHGALDDDLNTASGANIYDALENLKIFSAFPSDLTVSGLSTVAITARGPPIL